jgi:hypothetical protein
VGTIEFLKYCFTFNRYTQTLINPIMVAQAKGKNINASIGESVEDDGTSMHLPAFDALVNLPVNSIFPYAPGYGKKQNQEPG